VKPSLYIGGQYPNSPIRHRNVNKQTLGDIVKTLGYPIALNPIEADIYVSVDYNIENEELLRARKLAEKFNVLLRSEPHCVLPAGYSKKALELNNHIITFGRPNEDSTSEVWPQFWDENLVTHKTHERNNVCTVIVNANKLNLAKRELYTLRRKCIASLNNLALYGDSWNTSVMVRIRVAIIEILKNPIKHLFAFSFHSRYWFSRWPLIHAPEDKNEVLVRYKVSLVIENELSYLSEKLFDALVAGCIPVYVGPEIGDYEIPKSLVFQTEPNLRSIENQISLALKSDYVSFLHELERWLNSSETKAKHQGEFVITRALEKCEKEFLNFTNLNRK
jgi:hypothetical protein